VKSSDPIDDLNDLDYIRLYRLIAPPRTIHPSGTGNSPRPYRNIALNGFAYSLLNPTVAFVAAHWISDYFRGGIHAPPQAEIDAGKCHSG
jgi:dimethylaniline monooxygenase (N-oxide forming)